jgi:elongation factor P
MISTNDMRPGMTLELDGDLYTILEYGHHKPGKGQAMVRTKLRNLRSGAITDRTFRADEKVELARLERRQMQFLYSENSELVFMDTESFEQFPIPQELVGEDVHFLKEGQVVEVLQYQGDPVGIDLPTTVDLVVAQTDPGMQGDRSSAGTKPATLETGAVVQVPLFVSRGETVRVDTRTGTYVTRVR